MSLWELFVIAVGLSMDAFAVSICKGLSVKRCKVSHMLTCGLYFGVFQAAMPLIGFLLGSRFESLVTSIAQNGVKTGIKVSKAQYREILAVRRII